MKGQSLLETLLTLSLIFLFSFGGLLLVVDQGHSIAAKLWAAQHSRCMAKAQNQFYCQKRLTKTLWRAGFDLLSLRFSKEEGRLQTHLGIKSKKASQIIKGNYILYPYQYKRVGYE